MGGIKSRIQDCWAMVNGASMVVRIADNQQNFKNMDQVTDALSDAGLGQCNVIVGIDFTKSNLWTGQKSFEGRSLHSLELGRPKNPYLVAIDLIVTSSPPGETVQSFLESPNIPAFAFGDSRSLDTGVTPLSKDGVNGACRGFQEIVVKYKDAARKFELAGPTSFKPIIDKAIEIVERQRGYHILWILCDGQVTHERETIKAIVEASKYPLSIICIGIGDGPWEAMQDFDDKLPAREFDNFNFFSFSKILAEHEDSSKAMLTAQFALQALSEIPLQYIYIKRAFHGEHPFGHLSAFEKRQLKEAAEKAEKERRRKGDAGGKEAQQPAAPTMSDEEVAAQLSAAAE